MKIETNVNAGAFSAKVPPYKLFLPLLLVGLGCSSPVSPAASPDTSQGTTAGQVAAAQGEGAKPPNEPFVMTVQVAGVDYELRSSPPLHARITMTVKGGEEIGSCDFNRKFTDFDRFSFHKVPRRELMNDIIRAFKAADGVKVLQERRKGYLASLPKEPKRGPHKLLFVVSEPDRFRKAILDAVDDGRVQGCMRAGQKRSTYHLQERIALRMYIDAEGKVTSVTEDGLPNGHIVGDLKDCLSTTLQETRFPKVAAGSALVGFFVKEGDPL